MVSSLTSEINRWAEMCWKSTFSCAFCYILHEFNLLDTESFIYLEVVMSGGGDKKERKMAKSNMNTGSSMSVYSTNLSDQGGCIVLVQIRGSVGRD